MTRRVAGKGERDDDDVALVVVVVVAAAAVRKPCTFCLRATKPLSSFPSAIYKPPSYAFANQFFSLLLQKRGANSCIKVHGNHSFPPQWSSPFNAHNSHTRAIPPAFLFIFDQRNSSDVHAKPPYFTQVLLQKIEADVGVRS